jgi:hypothetical protein
MARVWEVFVLVLSAGGTVATAAVAQSQPVLAPSPGDGHFEVALHARSMRASARAEQAAWLTVTLPLDKLALPRAAQAPVAVPPPPTPAAPAQTAPAKPPATHPESAARGESAEPAEPTPPVVSFEQLRALSEFSRRATRTALAVAGAAAERRRLDSLSSRARASALLPEVRLRAVRNTDQALRWVPTTDDPYRVTQADGAGMILEASASFRLDRLLFAHEELLVERLRLRAGAVRLKLEARVEAALLGLFRARSMACASEPGDPAALTQVLKLLELFQELDALTAGWFSEQAPSFGRAVWGFPEAVLGVCKPPETREPLKTVAPTKAVASLGDSE